MSKTISLVCVAVFVMVTSLHAETKTEHLEAQFSVVIANSCGAEPVSIAGIIYGSITIVANANKVDIHSQWGPKGDVKAIGLETGNVYNVVGHTNSRWSSFSKGVTKFGYLDEFNIVGLYKVHYNFEFEYIEWLYNGEWYSRWKMEADNFRAVCQ